MRKIIASILRWQAKRLLRRNRSAVIVIVGSVGKTTTTQAIATVLHASFSVRSTIKNYNTDIGVPCSMFGVYIPDSLKSPVVWLRMFFENEKTIRRSTDPETYVLELGTDAPGEIAQFAWLQPDIAVVTAIAPEHMEYFGTIEAVAREELSVMAYSTRTVLNRSSVDTAFLSTEQQDAVLTYGRGDLNEARFKGATIRVRGDHILDAVAAAVTVGSELGMDDKAILEGVSNIVPQPGRMNTLEGIEGSTLLDDTYNASPVAVEAALEYLYGVKAPQRIALLGNMNELGDVSPEAHRAIGKRCDPDKLDFVVTLGPDANKFTAPAARERTCTVHEAATPYEAADIITRHLRKNAYILLKGSQNGVYAEEAVKLLLKDKRDIVNLVRQTDAWMKIKEQSIGAST